MPPKISSGIWAVLAIFGAIAADLSFHEDFIVSGITFVIGTLVSMVFSFIFILRAHNMTLPPLD